MTGPFLALLMAGGASSAARLRFVIVGVVEGSLVVLVGAAGPETAFLVTTGFAAVAFFEAVVVFVLGFFGAAAAGASSSRLRLVALGAGLVASTGALIELVAFLEAVVRAVVFADAAGAGAELEAARV
jgi:hypothetical protein